MEHRIPLFVSLRLFEVPDKSVEGHLQDVLRGLRLEKVRTARAEAEIDEVLDDRLSWEDKKRIRRRAEKIIEARKRFDQARHLKDKEREMIQPAARGVDLRGPTSEHRVDEIAATLFEEMASQTAK